MSEAELLELLAIYRTESGFHAMNFITIMSGYLAVAYFVGKKLTPFQVTAITFLYAAITPFPLLASIQAADLAGNLYKSYGHLIDLPPFVTLMESSPLVIGATITLSWIVSILFMFNVRRAENDEKST